MEEIKRLKDEPARKFFWQSIVNELGFEWYSFFFQPGDIRSAPRVLTNYPEDWKTEYMENEFGKIDPVHIRARNGLLPFYWGGEEFMRPLTRQQRRLFHSAHKFGISAGFTIPVHSPNHSYSLLTVATNYLTSAMKNSVMLSRDKLHIRAIYFHDLMQSDAATESASLELTTREKECLVLISNGKRYISVAEDMGVSTNTVQFHIKNIKRKMKVTTVQQAVALANSNYLIYS